MPLESPHNAVHLASGGVFQRGVYEANPVPYVNSNGDMGENNIAGLDQYSGFITALLTMLFGLGSKSKSL